MPRKRQRQGVFRNNSIVKPPLVCYNSRRFGRKEDMKTLKHVLTLNEKPLKASMVNGGCGECQTSCQSACKTSCTVGNQSCENENR